MENASSQMSPKKNKEGVGIVRSLSGWFKNHAVLPNTKKRNFVRMKSYFDKEAPEVALRSLFEKYDSNNDGMLDKKELNKLLHTDLGLSKEKCEMYRHLLDKDADNLISFEEFKKWLHSGERFKSITNKTRYYYLQKAIVNFKKYDTDENLAIDEREFHELYKDLGGCKLDEEQQAMFEIDLDHNGRVSFNEFLKWLSWVPLEHIIDDLD